METKDISYSARKFATGCWIDRNQNINELEAKDLEWEPLRTRVKDVADGCFGNSDNSYVKNRCKELLEEYQKYHDQQMVNKNPGI